MRSSSIVQADGSADALWKLLPHAKLDPYLYYPTVHRRLLASVVLFAVWHAYPRHVLAEPVANGAPATFASPPPRAVLADAELPLGWSRDRSLVIKRAGKQAPPARPATRTAVPTSAPAARVPLLSGPALDSWWEIFHDPELDKLEHLAVDANQNFESAVARVIQSRLRARIVAADLFPHLEARASARRSVNSDDSLIVRNSPRNDLNVAQTTVARSVTQNAFEGALGLSWEVDVFGRIRAAYASSQALAQATAADARGVRLSVTAEVADAYFALRTADEQVAILERTNALRQESLSLNEARVKSGIGLPDDVARAQLELNNVEADLAEAHRQRNALEKNLAQLCGQPSPDFRLPSRPLDMITPPARPRGVPAGLLTRRPDVAASERRLAATLQDIQQARAELLPRVTVGGFIGQASEDFDRLSNRSSREASIMPVISVPIFEGARNVANIRFARARRDEAAAAYRETVLTAFREADTALDDLQQRAVQSAAQERGVGNAQTVLQFSTDRYFKGAISYFQVVTDQANLLATQLGAARTRHARFAAVVDLARALGGGWTNPQEDERR